MWRSRVPVKSTSRQRAKRSQCLTEACLQRAGQSEAKWARFGYAIDHPAVGQVTSIGRRKLRPVPSQTEPGSASGLHGLLCTRGTTLGPGRSNFLPRYIHRFGPGRRTPQNNRRLHRRVHARLSFRPAYIYTVEARKEPNFSYQLLRVIYPAFRVLFPNQVIPADDLARAMVDVAVQETLETGGKVFENRDIRALVKVR